MHYYYSKTIRTSSKEFLYYPRFENNSGHSYVLFRQLDEKRRDFNEQPWLPLPNLYNMAEIFIFWADANFEKNWGYPTIKSEEFAETRSKKLRVVV